MNKTKLKRFVLRLVCVLAIAAIAVCTCGCEKRSTTLDVDTSGATVTEIGEGKTTFDFEVIDLEQKVTKFKVKTDKTIVGDALIENGLIEGDEGDFGLYVKKVNGIVADYDADQTYWAFYINGEMAMTGVDGTEIEEGAVYSFKIEK
jgi:hypothetical protein